MRANSFSNDVAVVNACVEEVIRKNVPFRRSRLGIKLAFDCSTAGDQWDPCHSFISN